jgi:ankyrin repeat protein
LARGAKPLGSTGNGKTALMLAAGLNVDRGVSPGTNHEAFELVKLIYELGDKDVNAVDDMGSTALHAAAQRGSKEIIQFLVDKGARLDVSTSFGWTPLDVARGYRNYLGVGRRVMRNVAPQPEVAAFVEKLMKDRGLETEHFSPTKQK